VQSATDPSFSELSSTITPETLSDKISYAFQLATAHGPLCHEPVQGIAVLLEEVILTPLSDGDSENLGRLTGEVIKTVRESIHSGFLDWSPRLLLATYSCEIQCTAEVLGPTYATLSRRHATILEESLHEGTPFFSITSHLPLASSFGFADEIRKKTSGAAQPQLVFCGFELLDEDPFWVPSTEEELEDLGTWGDRENVAKAHMDGVRRRKGLLVMERRGRVAEKQKTLKR
jgi:ribosome assembly protein 1